MKKLLYIFFFILSLKSFSQTTPLSFTQLGTTPDLIANDRGAEGWNGRVWDNGVGGAIKVPVGNVTRYNDYYRFLWRTDIAESPEGTYSFTTFDAQIHKAIDSGRIFSFGIMAMCDACGVNPSYPDYLHTLMQAESTNSKDWTDANGDWIPNWNSPNYLARYKALLMAVANHIATTTYKGVPYSKVIGYVDVRGYGDFGEWQTYPWTGTEPTGRTATAASLDSLVDFNRQAFPNFWNVNLQGVFDPSNSSQMPTAVTNYALAEKNNVGLFGWRRDQWGDPGDSVILNKNPHGSPITDSITNRYKEAPIVGEPQLTASTYNCGSILCDLPREVTFYHAKSFGNGNYANDGDANCQANVIQASANSGYRLVITSGTITTSIYRNYPFTVTLNWQNLGVTPIYYNYTVTYVLKNSGGTTVWTGNSSFNPRLFLPSASPTLITDNLHMTNVTPGSGYNLYVQLTDPNGYKRPLELAITGKQADGSYLVQSGITILNRNILVVIWGESNAAGMADNSQALPSEIGTRSEVAILDHNTKQLVSLKIGAGGNNQQNTFADTPNIEHGMELAMANEVDSNRLPNQTYLAKIGISGGVICQWFTGGCIKVGDMSNFDAWDNYMPYVDSAVKRMNALGVPYDIVVWGSMGLNNRYNQGTPAAHFYDSLKLFTQNFRTRVGQPNAEFYCTNFYNPPLQTYDWKYLFDSLAKVDPYFHSISCIGATYKDGGTHYDYQGFKLIVSNIVDSMATAPIPPTFHTSFIIGSGSGSVSLTSMTGHNPGDTAYIATQTGTYTSLTLQNLNGIIVRPQSGRTTFTTGSTFCNLKNMDIGFINFQAATGTIGIDMSCGIVDSSQFHNLYFQDWSSSCITFNNGGTSTTYIYGVDSTYKQLRNTYDSIQENHCNRLVDGAAGVSGVPKKDVAREITFSRIIDNNTSSTSNQGIGITGIFFHSTAHDIRITDTSGRPQSGDVGWFNGTGWWHIWNMYKYGGPGRLIRMFPLCEYRDTGSTYITNAAKFAGTEYGAVTYEFQSVDSAAGQFKGTSASTWNLMCGNQFNDNRGFWSSAVDNGLTAPSCHYPTHNIIGFAIGNNNNNANKPPLIDNLGGWNTIAGDTSNNQYYYSATVAKLDSTTVLFSNSSGNFPAFYITAVTPGIALQGGITNPFISTDYLGNAMRVPPDLGYIQFTGIPAPQCLCVPSLHSGFRKIFITH